MQKTDFHFEAVVHDDASTDGTAAIIKEYAERYPGIIKPICESENLYSKHDGSLKKVMDAETRGKYIAFCECDDYWTDPYKLQRQVDFMESHSEYSMCFHAADYLKGSDIIGNDKHFDKDCEVSTDHIISGGGLYCATASLLYRAGACDDIPIWRQMSDVGDYPLQIQLSLEGKVWYFASTMCVYRTGHSSSWVTNHGADLKHYEIECAWLKELDQATRHQYRNSIYQRITLFSVPLCRARRISPIELFRRISCLEKPIRKKWMKSFYKASSEWLVPKLYSLLRFYKNAVK